MSNKILVSHCRNFEHTINNSAFLKDRYDLIFSIMPNMVQLSKPKSFASSSEETAELDKMSEDLQVTFFEINAIV